MNYKIFSIAWKSIAGLDKLQLQCELLFFVEAATSFEYYDIANLLELLSAVGAKAVKEGKAKAREAHEEFIAKFLSRWSRNGAQTGQSRLRVAAVKASLQKRERRQDTLHSGSY